MISSRKINPLVFDTNQLNKRYMKTHNKIAFDQYYIYNYATETLINGNISECIQYLQGLFDYGKTGMRIIHDELCSINYYIPDRYEYVKNKVFS